MPLPRAGAGRYTAAGVEQLRLDLPLFLMPVVFSVSDSSPFRYLYFSLGIFRALNRLVRVFPCCSLLKNNPEPLDKRGLFVRSVF